MSYGEMFKWHPVSKDGMPKVKGFYWFQTGNGNPYIAYYNPEKCNFLVGDERGTTAWAGRLEIDQWKD